MLTDIRRILTREIWHCDLHAQPAPRRIVIFWLRMLHVLAQDLASGELTLRAMSLVYTTLLAIVPLLAFAFSVLKGLGVQDQMEPLLLDFLAPLGAKGEEISGKIINFVDNVKAGVLGTLGLLLLLYTAISLVRKVESTFNYVWRVREARTLTERFSHYVSVMLVGPLLIVAALGSTATASSHVMLQHIIDVAPLGKLLVVLARTLPYLLAIAAFTFLYIFMPHTHVQFRAALTGGIFAGVLWEFTGWAFTVLSISSTRLTAIYSSFAILIMFMIWIYLCWLILFIGAQVAFYVQNPELVRHGRGYEDVGGRTLERVALHIMYFIGRGYVDNKTPWSREELARHLHVPTDTILDVLGRLHELGLVTLVNGRVRRYMPARDMGTITLKDIVNSMRRNPPGAEDVDRHMRAVASVDQVVKQLDHAIGTALGDMTLRALVEQQAGTDIADLRRT